MLDGKELLDTLIDPQLWKRARNWLDEAPDVLEFVGERGWGKSTHLRVVQALAAERGLTTAWSYVPLGRRAIAWPRPAPCLWFIDEADRLAPWRRRAILRAARRGAFRVALGTHVSTVGECARCRAACVSIALSPADAATTMRFVETRVAAARDPDATNGILQLTSDAFAELCALSGNLREIEAILYEVFQRRANPGAAAGKIDSAAVRDAAAWVASHTRITVG